MTEGNEDVPTEAADGEGDADGAEGVDVRVRRFGSRTRESERGSGHDAIDSGADLTERARSVVEAVLAGGEPPLGDEESEALVSVARNADTFPVAVEPDRIDGSLSAFGAALVEPAREPSEVDEAPSLLDVVRDALWVARIAVSTTRRLAGYSLRSGVRTGARMLQAVGTSRSLDEFLAESQRVALEEMDRVGVDFSEERRAKNGRQEGTVDVTDLRERGEHLLELSADVEYEESVHPAYPDILDQLSPDEARMLRYLATEGPQPVVDVRDSGWLPVTSELVGAGLSMVGTEAGCRYEDRTQAYLNNLQRLGLVWFSDEQVDDVRRYQLVEAQPKVMEARDECTRPKVVRRSIHLTPFGVDFCRFCLPLGVVSDDASSVYHPPQDRANGNGDGNRGDDEGGSFGDGLDDAGEVSNGDSIRNPHLDDHWE
ncbi:DUF4393 domain-containing protein [Haladaptatus sp. F3-133]|uniref:DUF4393 domain-containing protein n=1 Tax=Halorutilus salinus TaxID=2487751 RepID=A0A9Q4GGS7_9EURY|nr:DUF4393 domain-containing protein [Halorutilus salinus]MCX2818060.1 DUF4393 domain-containing protein [Halorutilus salinus]